MRIGSLFSGIGGIEKGLEDAGLGRTVWQCEPEPVCRSILSKCWPGIPIFADVRDINGVHDEVERVEVLCGGFPCQDVSQAGKRVGIGGTRSGLWGEFARAIRSLRPKYVVVENVQGLVNRGLDEVLGDLAASGYDAEWTVFRACDIGVPHRRPRLFVVAYPSGLGLQVFREGDDQDWCDAFRTSHAGRSAAFPPGPEDPEAVWEAWAASGGPPPGLHREADGFPRRMDRVRVLGNSVVPLMAQAVGSALLSEIRRVEDVGS